MLKYITIFLLFLFLFSKLAYSNNDPSEYYRLSMKSYVKEEYDEAEKYALKGLEIFSKNKIKDHPLIADLNYQIGIINYKKAKYNIAENYITKAINYWEEHLDKNDTTLGHAYHLLSKAYKEQGKIEEAIIHLKQSIDIFTFHYGPVYQDVERLNKELESLNNSLSNTSIHSIGCENSSGLFLILSW